MKSQGLFAQNVLLRRRCCADSLSMEFVGRGNDYCANILALQQRFETSERVLDFKLFGYLPGACNIDIRDADQVSLRHETPQILRMAFAHIAHAEHSHTELVHFPLRGIKNS